MSGSIRLWIQTPVSSWTSRAAHSLALSCWFHFPLGKPSLLRTLISRTLDSSLLKTIAPQTGLFSCILMAILRGSKRRGAGANCVSRARNQLLSFSQFWGLLMHRMLSRQQYKAFSVWQERRFGFSIYCGGRLMMNLTKISSYSCCWCLYDDIPLYYMPLRVHNSYYFRGSAGEPQYRPG